MVNGKRNNYVNGKRRALDDRYLARTKRNRGSNFFCQRCRVSFARSTSVSFKFTDPPRSSNGNPFGFSCLERGTGGNSVWSLSSPGSQLIRSVDRSVWGFERRCFVCILGNNWKNAYSLGSAMERVVSLCRIILLFVLWWLRRLHVASLAFRLTIDQNLFAFGASLFRGSSVCFKRSRVGTEKVRNIPDW